VDNKFAPGRGQFLRLAVASCERVKRVVLLATGGAADEVRPHARDLTVSVSTCEFELDELVQQIEAFIAANLIAAWSKQLVKVDSAVLTCHRSS
jgi:hypothetical protein